MLMGSLLLPVANTNVVPAIFIHADGNVSQSFGEHERGALIKEEANVAAPPRAVRLASEGGRSLGEGQRKRRLGECTACVSLTATHQASSP